MIGSILLGVPSLPYDLSHHLGVDAPYYGEADTGEKEVIELCFSEPAARSRQHARCHPIQGAQIRRPPAGGHQAGKNI